jgi:hypothetical protein
MNQKVVTYVRDNLHRGYSHAQIAAHLRDAGYPDDDIAAALTAASRSHRRKLHFLIASAGLVALLILGLLAYQFVIAPASVEKPLVLKPVLSQQAEQEQVVGSIAAERTPVPLESVRTPVTAMELTYVLTEIGAYKLHPNIFTGELPVIEIFVVDEQKAFTAVVEDNKVLVQEGAAPKSDVRIAATQDAIHALAAAQDDADFKAKATQLLAERDERGLGGEVRTSEKNLLLKGYLALYNQNKDAVAAAGITGGAINNIPLAGSELLGMFLLVTVVWGILLLRFRWADD